MIRPIPTASRRFCTTENEVILTKPFSVWLGFVPPEYVHIIKPGQLSVCVSGDCTALEPQVQMMLTPTIMRNRRRH